MKISCPFCSQKYDVNEELLGGNLKCEICKQCFNCEIKINPIIDTLFLDIETSSENFKTARITTIIYYANDHWHEWINGISTNDEFIMFWNNSKELVTFNGKGFDERFICDYFNVEKHKNHTDLMIELKRINILGGLKEISEQLNIPRPEELKAVTGKTAIQLWKAYISDKDKEMALEYLLFYNAWDVVLTYILYYSVLLEQDYAPIQDRIPYKINPDHLRQLLTPATSKKRFSGKIQDFWEQKKLNPLETLNGAEICFTGELTNCEKDQAIMIVTQLGAINKTSAVRTLDFLVVADDVFESPTGKFKDAQKNIEKGAHTRILDESELWELVDRSKL